MPGAAKELDRFDLAYLHVIEAMNPDKPKLGAVNRSVRIGAIVAGEQPDAADLESLRGQGIRSVVNLRLSTEASFGLTPSRESRLAEELGLAYAHLPISAELLSDADDEDELVSPYIVPPII